MSFPADAPRPYYVPAGGPAGFLIEEQRTNNIRNPGGDASSVGAVPNYWQPQTNYGITLEWLGPVVRIGQRGQRVRLYGTATANGNVIINLETANSIAVSPGQWWAASLSLALVEKRGAGAENWGIRSIVRNSSGGAVSGESPTNSFAPDETLRRFDHTRQFGTDSTIAYFQPGLSFGVSVNGVYDTIFDVCAVQAEQASFPSTPILTAPGTFGATARAVDALSLDPRTLPGGGRKGTFLIRWMDLAGTAQSPNRGVFSWSDGSASNRLLGFVPSNSAIAMATRCTNGGTGYDAPTLSSFRPGSWNTYALTYGGSRFGHALNGVAASRNDAVLPLDVLLRYPIRPMGPGTSVSPTAGIVALIDFIPRVMSDAELSLISAN
ncbi:MAG TPA: hypothetical protein VNR89_04110 [Roseomonas sp.]|nr:hypothetical protein [Roseomonas sp.]